MVKRLDELCAGLTVLERNGAADCPVLGMAYDSRQVRPGFLFFALTGLHADGHRFVDAAVRAGAAAVVHSEALSRYEPQVAYLRVEDARHAMSPMAAAFFGRPSRDLAVIGVTGTEGKSTTVYLIYQLLTLAGKRAGFFSTVMSDTGGGERPNPEHQTTPEATAVQRMLAEMRDAGFGYAVVEASSHGLSPRTNRLGDVDFDIGVMMNVTHEHLEFHGSWENYRLDKANLFRAVACASPKAVPRFGVVNADDPSSGYFREAAGGRPVRSFSAAGAEADLAATDLSVDAEGESFTIVEARSGLRHPARLELPGAFNVGNALAALLVVSELIAVPVAGLVPLLPKLRPVRGRMSAVRRGQDFEVIVDYAHTPSSFRTIFPPLRDRVRGRLICLFGSGGERDREKRPQQGRIAADYCDIVILSDEDPRGEDPAALLGEIAAGCPERRLGEDLFIIPDRPSAIRAAFGMARAGDLVALLGKGHENSIIYKGGPIPYDEITEAERALDELLGPVRAHNEVSGSEGRAER
ncbi:MAG TPA: UDP-N-acetylmuramoyl-L-alanyl-D-glutamate--2,6-diaminopimelate ligase [Rectinemataceae bacterium]|nr:UDP-N-acetylmuramoyl-L-alanyl-D-glutamate--2,6-diaminopimelate ligase [Rectinemataceae bacterium]